MPDRIEIPLAPECAPCIIYSLKQLIPLLTDDPDEQFRLISVAMARVSEGFEKRTYPLPLSIDIYAELYELAGVEDPFTEVKKTSTQVAMRLLPEIEVIVNALEGYNRLRAAIAAAITGNLIDYSTAAHRPDLTSLLDDYQRILDEGFNPDHTSQLWQGVKSRNGVAVIVGDNAGEVIFDVPLVRLLRDEGWQVYYVVKGGPMANDATRDDVRDTPLEELTVITDTGAKAHGVPINMVSREFLSLLDEADLIISKGQANLESLPEIQEQLQFPVYYILRAKCPHMSRCYGVEVGSNVVMYWSPGVDEH